MDRDIKQFVYAECPECGKTIQLSGYCIIKSHKRDNGTVCLGSGHRVVGYRSRLMEYINSEQGKETLQ